MAEIRRCQECGGLVALIDPTPHIISLRMAWVHINRFGHIKKRVKHRPVV